MHFGATKKEKTILWVAGANLAVIAFIVTVFFLLQINRNNPVAFLQNAGAEYCNVAYQGSNVYVDQEPGEIIEELGQSTWQSVQIPGEDTYTADYILSWTKGGKELGSLAFWIDPEHTYVLTSQGERKGCFVSETGAYDQVRGIYQQAQKESTKRTAYLRSLGEIALQSLQYDQLQPEDFYLLAIGAQFGARSDMVRRGTDENGFVLFDADAARKAIQTYFPNQMQQVGFANEKITVGKERVAISRLVLDRHCFEAITQNTKSWNEALHHGPDPQYMAHGETKWIFTLDGTFETVRSEIILSKRTAQLQIEGAPEYYVSGLRVSRGGFDGDTLVDVTREAAPEIPVADCEPPPADPGWVLSGEDTRNHFTISTYYPKGTDLSPMRGSSTPLQMRIKVFDQRTKTVTDQSQLASITNQAFDSPHFIDTAGENWRNEQAFIAGRELAMIDSYGKITRRFVFENGSDFKYSFFFMQAKAETGEPVLYANRYNKEMESDGFWVWEPVSGGLRRLSDGHGQVQSDGNILLEIGTPLNMHCREYIVYDSKTQQVLCRAEIGNENDGANGAERDGCVWEQGMLFEYWSCGGERTVRCFDSQTGETTQYAVGPLPVWHLGRQGNSLFLSRRTQIAADVWDCAVYRLDLSDPQSGAVEIGGMSGNGIDDIRFEMDPQGGVRVYLTNTDYITPWGEAFDFHLQ